MQICLTKDNHRISLYKYLTNSESKEKNMLDMQFQKQCWDLNIICNILLK
jgi:hypothetical protein